MPHANAAKIWQLVRVPLPGRRVLVALLGVVAIALVILIITFKTRRPDPKLDDIGTVPPFHLVDERGQPFTDEGLSGHVTIVSFIFTRCPDICPVTSMKMEHLQEQLFDVGDRVKLLSISVDPKYDTPPRLTEYAQRYHADPTRWRFVTGPEDKVFDLVQNGLFSSMLHEGDVNGVPKIAHRGYFLLVDPQLHIRGKFEQDDPGMSELMRAARFLARTMI